MARVYFSSSPCFCITGTSQSSVISDPAAMKYMHPSKSLQFSNLSAMKCGSSLFFLTSMKKRNFCSRAKSPSIRCEQSSDESSGFGVWSSRLAMLGFVSAIVVELVTGKGLLENIGFTSPFPTLALAATAVVGILTAFLISQSVASPK